MKQRPASLSHSNKFFNPELEARTAEIQEEFNRLLLDKSPKKSPSKIPTKMDDFYSVMGDFYGADMPRHASPTRRLINQKNATWDHKELLSKHMRPSQVYKLHYTSSPDRSYVIEPKGGELDYQLAYKNPLKFYEQVMTQDIIEHRVSKEQQGLYLSVQVTKRMIGRILYAV